MIAEKRSNIMKRGIVTMKKNVSVDMTSRQARNMLSCAFENAVSVARKNCEDYIKWNPQDEKRRRRDLAIELCGINDLYYKMLEEIERAEKISRSAGIVNF